MNSWMHLHHLFIENRGHTIVVPVEQQEGPSDALPAAKCSFIFLIGRKQMKDKMLAAAILCFAFATAPGLNAAQTTKTQTPAPDNTKTNKTVDPKTTADQQKQNRSDLEIVRDIRQLITNDKELSTY